jgi:DNA-binding CsgD family transcriptional regulator
LERAVLSRSDLERGLRSLGAIAEQSADAAGFARAGVRVLPDLVASDLTTLSICHLASGRREVTGYPDEQLGAEDRACFDRHFATHPLVRFHGVQHGRGAHRISDSIPFARFREGALYSDYYRRIGIDHVVAVPLRVDRDVLVSFVLNRRRRDFSDRECQLLDRVGPVLARLHAALAAAPASLAADPAAQRLTPREHEVVDWLAAGKTDRDIGEILGCSHRTVQKHLQHIYEKLGVETRTAAVMRARVGPRR